MNSIEENVKKQVMYERYQLMNTDAYIGAISMRLEIVVCESYKGRAVRTAATDGKRLFVNPEYWMSIDKKLRKSLVIHETLHVALAHPLRRGPRNFGRWNKATDEAVNHQIKERGYEVGEAWICHDKYYGWSSERVYSDMDRKEKEQPEPPTTEVGDDQPAGSGEESGSDQEGGGSSECEESSGNECSEDTSDSGAGNQESGPSQDAEPDLTEEEEQRLAEECPGEVWDATDEDGKALTEGEINKEERQLAEDLSNAVLVQKTAGMSSSALQDRSVNSIISPPISWDIALQSFWSKSGDPAYSTWKRPNRNYLPTGLWVPSLEGSKLQWIVIGMDISGSIMQKECDAFVAQINSMRIESPAEKITIVPFNSVIQWDDIVEVYEDDEVPNRFNVGGGTNFRSITSWTRRQDEMPDALIIFTDLGSRSYGEEPDCPVMWASSYPVFDSPGYTNRPPFGEVIEIEI